MVYEFLIGYILTINIVAFTTALIDKLASIRQRRRIPEKTLFSLALLGGSVGLYLSMIIIRHKTRHLKFMLGVPLIIISQLLLIWLVLNHIP
ncbi:MAG: DUF1294 domain-containing protein [Clostridiaceae bacterium]|nr:DUF1294 domain-containing protein [Clostridiaceae bacterium]